MIDPKEEERLLADWGAPPPVRQINIDTHVGAAIQKPYASIEHLLARKRTGWHSFDDLKAAVEAAYPDGQQGSKVELGEDGTIYRWIKGHTGTSVADRHGVLQVEVFEERVPVALSQAEARAASAAGVRHDYFNGFSWVSRGVKIERDGPTMAAQPGANPNRKVGYEPADETTQMRHRAAVAATASRIGLTPMPAPADDTAPKAESRKGKD